LQNANAKFHKVESRHYSGEAENVCFCKTNLFRTICTKFYHNRSGFVDFIWKTFSCVFFRFTVYLSSYKLSLQWKAEIWKQASNLRVMNRPIKYTLLQRCLLLLFRRHSDGRTGLRSGWSIRQRYRNDVVQHEYWGDRCYQGASSRPPK